RAGSAQGPPPLSEPGYVSGRGYRRRDCEGRPARPEGPGGVRQEDRRALVPREPADRREVTLAATRSRRRGARPRTTMIDRGGGTIYPLDAIEAISAWARANGLAMRLDGARLWNAIVASGIGPREWARHFDTVSVCFSKGLGAPVGSALAGPKDLIAQGRRI